MRLRSSQEAEYKLGSIQEALPPDGLRTSYHERLNSASRTKRYNPAMRIVVSFLLNLCLALTAMAETPPSSATVPITLDHNRIIVDVRLPLPDGDTKRVRAWVDNGNPELWIAESAAKAMGLDLSGEQKEEFGLKVLTTKPPKQFTLGGLQIDLGGVKEAKIVMGRSVIFSGLSAAMNLPAPVLRNYDVVIDYPNREFTLAQRGSLHHKGEAVKALLNSENSLLQIPSQIDGQKFNLGFDVGASFSFLGTTIIDSLRKKHAAWPRMTGATGEANLWGIPDEPKWTLLRIPVMQYGSVSLKQVGVASYAKEFLDWFEKRAGVPTMGLIGGNAFLAYRIGIDYANSTVYFDHSGRDPIPAMDVVGLVLRPAADERYTIIGVADLGGKPSVTDVKAGDVLLSVDKVPATGGTMGQVWSLLGGRPGEGRTLVLEREGKQITVKATVRRFLGAAPAAGSGEKSKSSSTRK